MIKRILGSNPLRHPRRPVFFVGILFFVLFGAAFPSQAGVVNGKVTSVRGNVMESDLGSEKGIQAGDTGKIYYNILVGGKEKAIYIARFKITQTTEKSSSAQIQEKTGEVKIGYGVEITFKDGELEVSSEPPGAKVFVDSRATGETPIVLSNVRPGERVIRIAKEGYGPHEERVKIVEGEKKKVSISMKKAPGALFVNTSPAGANIYIDGKPVGVSPYEGRDLDPRVYRIRAVKEGYEVWEREQTVEAGKKMEVIAHLKEVLMGRLSISTDPPGAHIQINGKPVGVSPYEAKDLATGSYKVRLSKEGYDSWERDVAVEAGKRVDLQTMLRERRKEVAVSPPPAKPEAPRAKEGKNAAEGPKVTPKFEIPKKTSEAPVWTVGAKWMFRKVTEETWTNVVTEARTDSFVLKVAGAEDYIYDRKTMNILFRVGKDGKRMPDDPYKNVLNFPLFVGKKWSYTIPWRDYRLENEVLVEGIEEVETVAGKFVAYRIYYKQRVPHVSKEAWIRYWYAPEAGFWVKRVFEKKDFWENQAWARDTELIYFRLK